MVVLPIKTLQQLMTKVCKRQGTSGSQGALYKIKHCQATYFGEPGQQFKQNNRMAESKRATIHGDLKDNISETISKIITKLSRTLLNALPTAERLTLKSCFTDLEQSPLSRLNNDTILFPENL